MNEGLHIREQKSCNHNKKLQQFHNKANLVVKFEKKKNIYIEIADYGGPCSGLESENYFEVR
jgi:hypothetical protein